tara:strand:- start:247 stop:423 length:177 start_codon:yes stop_codon:yes gene_type:complete
MEIKKVKNYEVWIEGTLGIHKGKPLLYSVYTTYPQAQSAMQRLLRSGRYATVVSKESK